MKETLTSYFKFDGFVKMQLVEAFIVTLSWSLIVPAIVKLRGAMWAASIISIYLILYRLSAFVAPYFKNIEVKTIYKYIIIIDVVYLIVVVTYYIDPNIFLHTEALLMFLYSIVTIAFGINFNAFFIKRYDESIYKDYKYLGNIISAIAAIIGYAIVIVIDTATPNIDVLMNTFTLALIFAIGIQIYNYRKYWNKISENSEQ